MDIIMINKEAWEAGYLAGKGLIKEATTSGAEIGAHYLTPILTTGAGALIGAGINRAVYGRGSERSGAVVGAGIGAGIALAAFLAAGIGTVFTKTRTKKEQREVDKQSFARNLIPGVASYNNWKRFDHDIAVQQRKMNKADKIIKNNKKGGNND